MSDQYNSTADGLSGGDGAPSNDTITAGQYDELNELLRQVEEQEQKLRELKAEERIANKRLAILGVVAKKAAESPLDEEDKARAEAIINAADKMYEDAGYAASLEKIKALEELFMRMALPELKDFIDNLMRMTSHEIKDLINSLIPQAAEADAVVEG